MITLEIPRATPSMNSTHHKHWRVMHAQKKLWLKEIWIAAHQVKGFAAWNKLPAATWIRAKVTIERYSRGELDDDNFRGGLKSVLDALKLNGLIIDDNSKHLELVATQHKGTPRTIIKIEPA